jgi:hypothetical protein
MKYIISIISVILIFILIFKIDNTVNENEITINKLDLPEEFNIETISHDRNNPTLLMAVYDTISKKYIFEFTDK